MDLTDLGVDPARLWVAQADGSHSVAEIYKFVKTGVEPTEEQLGGDVEFRRLAKMLSSMRITGQGVLQVCLAVNGNSRWCTVCPPTWRDGVIQETPLLTHA